MTFNPNQKKDPEKSSETLNKNKQQPLPGGARQDGRTTTGGDMSQKGKIPAGGSTQQGTKQGTVNPWDKQQRNK